MLDAERDAVFGQWLGAHAAILFKVARAYGATPSDREDLFQEIALQVWRSVDGFRGDAAVSTWIYRIALHTALAWRRQEARRGRAPVDVLVAPSPPDPRLEWIYARVAELHEVDRSLALLWLDGASYREISDILGISESHVGVKLHRIKAALTALLDKESPDGPR